MDKMEVTGYALLVDDIKELIHKKQYSVLQVMNAETINLYWEIGEDIYERFSLLDIQPIFHLLWDIPVLSEVQKKFYHAVMECRYDRVFLPLYQKIIGRKKACEAGEVQEKKERGRQHV